MFPFLSLVDKELYLVCSFINSSIFFSDSLMQYIKTLIISCVRKVKSPLLLFIFVIASFIFSSKNENVSKNEIPLRIEPLYEFFKRDIRESIITSYVLSPNMLFPLTAYTTLAAFVNKDDIFDVFTVSTNEECISPKLGSSIFFLPKKILAITIGVVFVFEISTKFL